MFTYRAENKGVAGGVLESWLANYCELFFLASLSGGQVRFRIRGFCLDSRLYDGCWLLILTSTGVLLVVGGLLPLGCWHRHPGVKTGVDHYDIQSLNIHIPFQHYSCLDSRVWMVDTSGAGDC